MAAFGLTRSDVADEQRVEVWPDNWEAASLFAALVTQWRTGFGGAIGLDYAALPFVMRMRRVARDRWPAMFDDLRILEAEALETMREPE